MAAPENILRSYGGGAEPAQLVNEIGASELSFAISLTTGWVEEGTTNPLGTSGPFTVVADRFTASVEKILCSSVNLTTGVVDVYNVGGFTGRGYDGTTAQAHVPGGSTSGIQTCWTAQEALEANAAVVVLLGGSPADGDVFQIVGGSPTYAPNPSGLAGAPCGRIYQSTPLSMAYTGTPVVLTHFSPSFLLGGFTNPTTSGELIVPVTGTYRVTGVIQYNLASAAVDPSAGLSNFIGALLLNGTEFAEDDFALSLPAIGGGSVTCAGPFSVKASSLVAASATDVLTMSAFQNMHTTVNGTTVAGTTKTWLEAELVSA